MKKKDIRRINLWLDKPLYDQIHRNADEAFLKVGTYTRQLIQQTLKKNQK